MVVSELILALQDMPQDAYVYVGFYDYDNSRVVEVPMSSIERDEYGFSITIK